MNENKNIHNNNEEIEIDLRELWVELKKNFWLIVGVTATFVVAVVIYSFMIAKPVYQCSSLIRIPSNVNSTQLNTCVELLKANIGVAPSLSGASLLKNTYVIKLNFSGPDTQKIQQDRDNFLPKAIEKIDVVLYEEGKRRLADEVIRTIRQDISTITAKLIDSDVTTMDINNRVDFLVNKIETREQFYVFPKAEIVREANTSSSLVSPNKKKNIVLAFVAGMFLSCGFVVTRYIFNKEA